MTPTKLCIWMISVVATVALACSHKDDDARMSTYSDFYERYSDSNFDGLYDLRFMLKDEERRARVEWAIFEGTTARAQISESVGRSVTWIYDGEHHTVCLSEDAACYPLKPQEGYTGPDPDSPSPDDTQLLDTASRTIAGIEARCFVLTGEPPLENGTECLSRDGVVLYSSGITAGSLLVFLFLDVDNGEFQQDEELFDLRSVELVAVQIDQNPTSISLDPPFEVVEIGSE